MGWWNKLARDYMKKKDEKPVVEKTAEEVRREALAKEKEESKK